MNNTNKDIKYYYDCDWDDFKAHEAIYMQDFFNVEFLGEDKKSYVLVESILTGIGKRLMFVSPNGNKVKACRRVYVEPNSNHIFEPQEGDLMDVRWLNSNKKDSLYKGSTRDVFILPCEWGEFLTYTPESVEILKRDNKAFFMPKLINNED